MLKALNFIDLFCGGGFGARGAVSGGGKPLLAIDAWDLAVETYRTNFPEATVLHEKIENIDPFQYAALFEPDVLLTSPECTSHSIARGSKPGNEKSRETAISIFPWIEAFNPRWVIVENVNRMKLWGRHEELIATLEAYGYKVNQMILNAAEFGTPQSRKRLFLVCDREGTVITRETLLKTHKKTIQKARSIIDWTDRFKSTQLHSAGRAKSTLERAERAIETLGRNIPFLIVYYGSDYAGGWQTLDAPLRTVTTIDRFGLVTWLNGEPMLRMLQPSELLRAMGTDETHLLPAGNRRDKVKLCGNGVCSPVTEMIFREIRRIMESEYPLTVTV